MKHDPITLIVTFFGAGRARFASGTVGSLAALPPAFLIQYFLGSMALMLASMIAYAVGTWACDRYLQRHPEKSDPKEIVIDEVAGQWLLLSVLFPTWKSYLIGFFLFRLFDVVKPWPVSWADQKVKGGTGVMLDDMLAACYPIALLLLLYLEVWLSGRSDLLTPIMLFLGA